MVRTLNISFFSGFFIITAKRYNQQTYYEQAGESVRKWKGFTLKAADGSIAYLFNDKANKMEEYFGLHRGKVMARLMVCYDVLNELIVLGRMDKIKTSENAIVYDWLDTLQAEMSETERSLMLYDAKFAGFRMIYEHLERKLDFVMRSSPEFSIQIKRFVESGKKQQIIDMHPTTQAVKEMQELGYSINMDTRLKVRLVRIELADGKIEVLITSLLDKKKYPHSDFQPLYQLRWGSETCYDTLKNKLQIEVVSGHSPEAVLQDFHAALMLSNLQSVVEQECRKEVEQISGRRKYDYAVNENVAIGCMKHRVVQLFISEQPEEILDQLKVLFIKHTEPIRPDRSLPRIKKIQHLNGKYKTQKNYRRAI
ncbi:MAG: IS4 family transposase [Chitinophagales bacterium]